MSSTKSTIDPLATAVDLPQRLACVLDAGHRHRSQRPSMSPQLSYGRHAGPAPYSARAAAVLLLLFRRHGRWLLPLTERPATLAHHGGQISLPGGSVEPNESSEAAALRELDEELGVKDDIRILGKLADCYVFASDFLITPWVATVPFEPEWQPHSAEVAGVVELPLDHLLGDHSLGRLTIERGPLVFHAPCIRFGQARVWGATSIILGELADAVRAL